VTYQTTLSNTLLRTQTSFVDYVADSPTTVGFINANLKYLGLEITPGTHVD